MGKVWITDEVNDNYTADVTSSKELKVLDAASNFYRVPSAAASGSKTIASAGCWLKRVIIGSSPATSTVVHIYNISGSAASAQSEVLSCTSAQQIVARLIVPVTSTTAVTLMPRSIPFNVYLASGLCVGLGDDGVKGDLDGVTIVYQI